MKNVEELREIKAKYKRGEITIADLDDETLEQLIELYDDDIKKLDDDIIVLKEENRMFDKKIAQLKENIKNDKKG